MNGSLSPSVKCQNDDAARVVLTDMILQRFTARCTGPPEKHQANINNYHIKICIEKKVGLYFNHSGLKGVLEADIPIAENLCLRVLISLTSVLAWTMRGEGDTEELGLRIMPGVPTGEMFGTHSEDGEDGSEIGFSST